MHILANLIGLLVINIGAILYCKLDDKNQENLSFIIIVLSNLIGGLLFRL